MAVGARFGGSSKDLVAVVRIPQFFVCVCVLFCFFGGFKKQRQESKRKWAVVEEALIPI